MKCVVPLSIRHCWRLGDLLLSLSVLVSLESGRSEIVGRYFHAVNNAVLQFETETGNENETYTKTRLACVAMCPECSAVSFDDTTYHCKFSNRQEFAIVATVNPDLNVWISTKTVLFNVRREDGSELTQDDASQLCGTLNSQIADPGDMYKADEHGYNLCRCGFAAYGSPRMILNQTDPSCLHSNGASSVISCKTLLTTPHVYCKL